MSVYNIHISINKTNSFALSTLTALQASLTLAFIRTKALSISDILSISGVSFAEQVHRIWSKSAVQI